MAGTYIEDLPLFGEIKETDEVIVERVEGDVRTTGRMTVGNLLGFLIPSPVIDSASQDGTTVSLITTGAGGVVEYSIVKIDGTVYPAENFPPSQINVDITGLSAGAHDFVIINKYKQSASFEFTTT